MSQANSEWLKRERRRSRATLALRRRIASTTLRTLKWGDRHVPPGVRSVLGAVLMVAGVFGFLPIVGFWMFPLGVAFVALDIPWTKHHIHAWMARLEARLRERAGHGTPSHAQRKAPN